mmetsp:Transcript_83753/g.122543  ORF Transcript_83753/g.122543 Transcript_83753/m.122543 type:complete len:85 (-) Transcript_83753:9-263(-)
MRNDTKKYFAEIRAFTQSVLVRGFCKNALCCANLEEIIVVAVCFFLEFFGDSQKGTHNSSTASTAMHDVCLCQSQISWEVWQTD